MSKENMNLLTFIVDGLEIMMTDTEAEIRTLSFWRAVTAECLSTFLYLVLLCSIHSTVSSDPDLPYSLAQVYCGVVAGLGITAITTVFLPVSGAHINPAITITSALIQTITPVRALAYVSAQCCGAVAGAGAVIGLTGSGQQSTDVKITDLGLELVVTFLVVMVFLRVTEDSKERAKHPEISIGLSYVAGLSAHGVALNPAGALGLAFMCNKYNNHWVQWVGPILGGTVAGLCHRIVFSDSKSSGTEETFDENKYKFENNKKISDTMENVRMFSESLILTNSLKFDTRDAEQTIDTQTLPKKNDVSCPVVQQKSSVKSQSRRKKCSSLPKGASYQHSCAKVVDEIKESQTDGRGVKEVRVKKRVHYTKDSFDEGFTDTEDRNSGSSSGYYSGCVNQI